MPALSWTDAQVIGDKAERFVELARALGYSGTVEVKSCQAGYGAAFVERRYRGSQGWQPSGLDVTEADCWAFAVRDQDGKQLSAVIVPTSRLKRLCEGRPLVSGAGGATRGHVISLGELAAA